MMASIEEAVQRADQNSRNQNAGMDDLFGEVVPEQNEDEDIYASSANVREWSDKVRLNGEKDTLGLYLTGHPFDEYEKEIRQFVGTSIRELKPKRDTQSIAGLVVGFRTMKSKKGDTMAFLMLDDRSARIEVAFFAEAYNQARDFLQKDAILIIEGEVSEDRRNPDELKVSAKKCYDVTAARKQHAKGLVVKLDESMLKNGLLKELQDTLTPYKEEDCCPVYIQYTRSDARSVIQFGDQWKVLPSDDLVQGLKTMVGSENVAMKYS